MLDDEWIRVISNCWCIIYSHHIEKSTKSNLSVKFVTIKTVCVLPSHKLHIVFSFLLLLVPASSAIRFSYRNDQNWRLNTQKLIKNPLDLKKLRFQIPRYSNLSPTHLIASDRIATFAFQHSSSLVFNILEALKKVMNPNRLSYSIWLYGNCWFPFWTFDERHCDMNEETRK